MPVEKQEMIHSVVGDDAFEFSMFARHDRIVDVDVARGFRRLFDDISP